MKTFVPLIAMAAFLLGCEVGPKPIEYGFDACEFCSMTIVDKQHAAEIVTRKGKVYKYDAIECMLNDVENNSKERVAYYLVTDYSSPGELIDALEATYLVSESIPSPMGEYLTSFKTIREAEAVKTAKTGTIYSWEEIWSDFTN